jgi:hypothetical protein
MEQVREDNILGKVPYRRVKGVEADGRIFVVMPKFDRPWKEKAAKALGFPLEVSIKLDARSSAAWKLIDGRTTVRAIGETMHGEFGEKIEPLYPRLAVLLRIMEQNHLIGYRKVRRRRARPKRPARSRPNSTELKTKEGSDAAESPD